MANFIKTLAGDLLNLEVNTIIKENSSSAKMPTSRRVALYQVAEKYRNYLIEHGLASHVPQSSASDQDSSRNRYFKWRFGGEYSFVEIMSVASSARDELEWRQMQAKTEKDRSKIEKVRLLIDRIVSKSSNLVGLFKMRRKEYEAEITASKQGFDGEKINTSNFRELEEYPSHPASAGWNNDLSLQDINQEEDIDLTPEHITLIRKIWEIGMEQVLLQTTIQIDGDITSVIAKDFLRMPEKTKEMVMGVHNDSISSSTHIWKMLFETIGKLAGKAFHKIFEKSKKA